MRVVKIERVKVRPHSFEVIQLAGHTGRTELLSMRSTIAHADLAGLFVICVTHGGSVIAKRTSVFFFFFFFVGGCRKEIEVCIIICCGSFVWKINTVRLL